MHLVSHLTSCTHTKFNLYLPNSLATAFPLQAHHIPSTKCHVPFPLLMSYQTLVQARGFLCETFRNVIRFYGEKLLAPRPTLKDHPLSAVRGCLFNIFTATLHIGGRPSIRNPTTRHAVATGTNLSHRLLFVFVNFQYVPVLSV